jgi:hypothetical protein
MTPNGMWRARICVERGVLTCLGLYLREEDAAAAYDAAAAEHFGEFARLNFPDVPSGRITVSVQLNPVGSIRSQKRTSTSNLDENLDIESQDWRGQCKIGVVVCPSGSGSRRSARGSEGL